MMKMKRKMLMALGIGVILSSIFTSCLDDPKDNSQTYEEEMIKLDEYLNTLHADGYDVDTTDLGVYYVTIEEGVGDYPENNDTLTVSFTGYLIDGSWFDSTRLSGTDTTATFIMGDEGNIPGWNDGMKVINKEALVELIIPSTLAYGSNGSSVIPPNNSLIFVVKMVDIKKP